MGDEVRLRVNVYGNVVDSFQPVASICLRIRRRILSRLAESLRPRQPAWNASSPEPNARNRTNST